MSDWFEIVKAVFSCVGGAGFIGKLCGIIIVAKKLGWRKLWARLKELVGSEIKNEVDLEPKKFEEEN